jgi:hypothetical protein
VAKFAVVPVGQVRTQEPTGGVVVLEGAKKATAVQTVHLVAVVEVQLLQFRGQGVQPLTAAS